MARTDSSATRTPAIFIALAVTLFALRIGLAASATTESTESRATSWKTATEADKLELPGAEDPKETETQVRPKPKIIAIGASKNADWIKSLPLSDADKEAVENGKPVLYQFVAEWSDPCKAMDKNALSNKRIAESIEQHFVPIRVRDLAHEEGKNPKWISNLQRRYHIFALPTLVITDKSGEPKASLIGNCSSLTVERFLARAMHNKY